MNRIDGLQILQKRWTQQQLLDAIIEHYKSGILANIYKFVLGLDILGNPTKLVGGLGTGLTKLVTEPVQVQNSLSNSKELSVLYTS